MPAVRTIGGLVLPTSSIVSRVVPTRSLHFQSLDSKDASARSARALTNKVAELLRLWSHLFFRIVLVRRMNTFARQVYERCSSVRPCARAAADFACRSYLRCKAVFVVEDPQFRHDAAENERKRQRHH